MRIDFTSSILRFVNGRNNTSSFLRDQIEYITDPVKTDGGTLVATQGCACTDPLSDILTNKRLHQQPHGKQSVHFVLSCASNGVAKSPFELLKVTQEIVKTVYSDYLAVMAVHTDSKVVHSHVVLDAVNAVTGKKFSQGPSDLNRVKQKANGILKAHGFEIIRISTNDFVDHTDYSHTEGFDFLELDESDLFPDTELISETDMAIIDSEVALYTDEEVSEIANRLSRFSPYHKKSNGGFFSMTTNCNNALNAPKELTTPMKAQEVISTISSGTSSIPTTAVVTGPTFRIHGSEDSDFCGLADLAMQTTAYAQEHQLEAANLALAMQVKAQDSGHPTNVTVVAGPIFDIDLCGGDNSPQLYYGDDGEPYYE